MEQQITVEESAASNPDTQAAAKEEEQPEEEEPEENVLSVPDEITDVILEVEGKELHTNRAVLAHYSPVFRAMFYSTFREKSCDKVPLPGKRYDSMVTFCNVLYPRSASAKCLIDDSNLMDLLTLADEYQTNKVMVACQNYIGDELCNVLHRCCLRLANQFSALQEARQSNYRGRSSSSTASRCRQGRAVAVTPQMQTTTKIPDNRGKKISKKLMIDKLLLYLWACDAYRMPVYREALKSLLIDMAVVLEDLSQSRHYSSLPQVTRVDLTEELCRHLDGSRQFAKTDVSGVASVSLF